jgi:hypothetical protein
MDEMDSADLYKVLPPTEADYRFFSAVHGTFYKMDHILDHKTSINKYKKIKIIPCICADQN